MKLTDDQLKEINGGFKAGILAFIGAAITFLIGVVDGYVRPLPCR